MSYTYSTVIRKRDVQNPKEAKKSNVYEHHLIERTQVQFLNDIVVCLYCILIKTIFVILKIRLENLDIHISVLSKNKMFVFFTTTKGPTLFSKFKYCLMLFQKADASVIYTNGWNKLLKSPFYTNLYKPLAITVKGHSYKLAENQLFLTQYLSITTMHYLPRS